MILLRHQFTRLDINLWLCSGQFVPKKGHKFWSRLWAVSIVAVVSPCTNSVCSSVASLLTGLDDVLGRVERMEQVYLVLFLMRHKQATLVAMRRTSVSPEGESVERRASKWRRCGAPVNSVVFSWLGPRMLPGNRVTFIAVSAGKMCRR